MFKAILFKELLKIRSIYFLLIFLLFTVLIFLYFDIIKSFHAIEPHSMLWYEAVFIGNIYYEVLKFFPTLCAITIALAQFLPEIHRKKFRIPLHLPINQNKMVLLYLLVGLSLLTIINILYLSGLYLTSSTFYPDIITNSSIINSMTWILASYIIYNAIAAIMIEPYLKRKSFIFILFLLISSMLFINQEYEAYNNVFLFYTCIFFLSFSVALLSLYRFKNGNISLEKNHTLISKFAIFVLILLSFFTLSFYLPKIYKDLVSDDSLSTYVFYSNKDKKFVYKKHFGEHNFTYKDNLGNNLEAKEFEESLPFVYWRNLDIQKKLPVTIDNIVYDKRTIKKARQSFKFDYRDFKQNHKQIKFYPLFNPNSKIGMIPFPNLMFTLKNDFSVYNSESNKVDRVLSKEYTNILKKNNFSFPAKIIAGKTTNIKPLDEGYFILDSKKNLFHMKLSDDKMYIKKIIYDKNIQIKYIKISENRKKEFYGIVLDSKDRVYVISYDNYNFIKLPIENFYSKNMKLEIYANPINKLIRYENNKETYAVVLDKEFNFIDKYKIDIPQINSIYTDIYTSIFPFIISKNNYKKYEEYSLVFNSYKGFILGFIFAFIYFIFNRKKDLLQILIKSILLAIGGIYTLLIITFL